ncbi:hypothetical protein AcV7_005052 [Taiwanofungus camphoratus]|nr:hypothetical protein AcV7_005052 [Antrodia cinnamomea]
MSNIEQSYNVPVQKTNAIAERGQKVPQQRYLGSPVSTPSSSTATLLQDETRIPSDSSTTATRMSQRDYQRWVDKGTEQAQHAWLGSWHHLHSSQHSPVSAITAFNPLAMPFVPATLRVQPTWLSPQAPVKDVLQVQHPWMRHLRACLTTGDRRVHLAYARDIVEMGPWDSAVIAVIAGKISGRAVEGFGPELEPVAAFARTMYNTFKDILDEAHAALFQHHLWQYVWSEFQAWWHPDSPTAVFKLAYTQHPEAHVYLTSAYAVAMFVSDLFVQQLVSSDCVFGCLQMITSRISVLEDVLAVHAIISHANERLYDRQTMYAFMGAFKQRARMICNNASAVGEQFTQAHVQPYVQDVSDTIEKWAEARHPAAPPSASGASVEHTVQQGQFIPRLGAACLQSVVLNARMRHRHSCTVTNATGTV